MVNQIDVIVKRFGYLFFLAFSGRPTAIKSGNCKLARVNRLIQSLYTVPCRSLLRWEAVTQGFARGSRIPIFVHTALGLLTTDHSFYVDYQQETSYIPVAHQQEDGRGLERRRGPEVVRPKAKDFGLTPAALKRRETEVV